ncbi:MAG TPA: hypothetical protein VJB70_03985 [Candidatus Paceibacterota bacterium]
MRNMHKNKGLIKLVIIIIVAILVLSYFSIDIRGVVESPQSQANFGYVGAWVSTIWNTYLARPFSYLWNDIFIDLLWESFTDNLEKIKRGEPHDFNQNPPQVPQEAGNEGVVGN